MKRLMYLLAVMALTATFVACEKNELEIPHKITHDDKKSKDILKFSSVQSFNLNINERNIVKASNTRSSTDSYPLFIEKNLESGFFESEDQVEDLIPEIAFREALNENFEVIINDSIYKVTSLGVLYASVNSQNELRKLTQDEIKKMPRVGEKELSNGEIHLYETFKNLYTDSLSSDEVNINNNISNFSNITLRSGSVPYNQFKEVGVNRFTIVGKWWQNVVGVDKHYTLPIEGIKKHRFKASIFSYDYKIRSRAGFRGRINKRNLIGYWYVPKHWENDIVIESKSFIFSAPNRQPMPPNSDRFAPNYELIRNDQDILIEKYKSISEDDAVKQLQKTIGHKTHIIITSSRIFVCLGDMKHSVKGSDNTLLVENIPVKFMVSLDSKKGLLKNVWDTLKATFGEKYDGVRIYRADAYIYTSYNNKYYGFQFVER